MSFVAHPAPNYFLGNKQIGYNPNWVSNLKWRK